MIPLYKPYMPDVLPELDEILHSGALAYGKWGREFEQSLKEYIGCTETPLIVNSYTAAIQVMLMAVGVGIGDEIIASPQCCLASTMPLISTGAKIIWADIDPNTGTLDPQDVEKKITPRTKLIFHNHHCSNPGYINEINSIANKHGILAVDDCIEAFGSEYEGRKLGDQDTPITTLSFQTVRLPNTIDGGAIIFKDRDLLKKASKIRDLSVDRSTFRNSMGEINPESDVLSPGFGVTMNEISSYIGYMQLKHVPELMKKQRENALKWDEFFRERTDIVPVSKSNESSNPSYWVYSVLSDNKLVDLKRFREEGFYASGVHLPNTFYSVFGKQDMPKGVHEFYSRFIALPSGWWSQI